MLQEQRAPGSRRRPKDEAVDQCSFAPRSSKTDLRDAADDVTLHCSTDLLRHYSSSRDLGSRKTFQHIHTRLSARQRILVDRGRPVCQVGLESTHGAVRHNLPALCNNRI